MLGSTPDQSRLATQREDRQVAGREGDGRLVVEQSAIEIRDLVAAVLAAGAHLANRFPHRSANFSGSVCDRSTILVKRVFGQQADVLGEEAEHHLHQKVGDRIAGGLEQVKIAWRVALDQPVGELAELAGQVERDFFGFLGRPEVSGVGEDPPEDFETAGDLFELDDGLFGRVARGSGVRISVVRISQTTESGGLSSASRYW